MTENNLTFYLKRWFFNRYTLLTAVVLVTAVLFVFNQKKLFALIDLQDDADAVYELALAEEQAQLAALGLERDPGEASYVEIMESKDYDFSDTESLKLRDSDNDGLNDYQEIYIYQSSAFLEDTDGDKLSDATEVKNGTDPLCAEGDVCGVDNTEKDLAQKDALIESTYVAEDLSALMEDLSSIDITQMDPAELREALLANGVSASEIDGLSDEEIIQLYQMALNDYQGELTSDTVTADEIDWDNIDLSTMSQDDLRSALLDSGLEQSEIDVLSDEDVIQLYEMAIEEYKSQNIDVESTEPVLIDENDLENLTAAEIRYLLIQEGADEADLSEISDEDLEVLFQEAIAETEK